MSGTRFVAALLLLQVRGRVTAAELADELGVSVATARRDLDAMAAAGIPVYPQPGRNGGWSLVGGARTDLSGLHADEVHALFRLVGPAAAVSEEARTALRKLVRALPSTFRDEALRTASTTVLDPSRWGERPAPEASAVGLLQRAAARRQRVSIDYESPRGERSTREVEPWAVIDKGGTWYLLAGTERGRRTFRVDRIIEVRTSTDTFEGVDRATIDAAWAEVVAEMEDRRSRTRATVRIPARFLWVLRDHFGRHLEVGTRRGELVEVRVAAPTATDLARQLSGWGRIVEVLDPPEVRAELARIGAELVEAYGSP